MHLCKRAYSKTWPGLAPLAILKKMWEKFSGKKIIMVLKTIL